MGNAEYMGVVLRQPWRSRYTSSIVVDEGTPPSSARSSRNLRLNSGTRWRGLQRQQATWRWRLWEVLFCTARREAMDMLTHRRRWTRSLPGWRRLLPKKPNVAKGIFLERVL